MSISFTLGNSSFSALTISGGRKAKFIKFGSEHHVQIRYHPFGTTGNYLVRGGRDGMPIIAGVRYIGPLAGNAADPNVLFRADCSAWSNAAISITTESGQTFDTCNLVTADRVSNPSPIGRGTGLVCFDAVFTFTWDA